MYVPDDSVLGNPGVIGFLGGVAKKVGSALGISGIKVSIPAPQVSITPTAQAVEDQVQSMVQRGVQSVPSWVLPAAIAAGLVLFLKPRRGR